MKTYKISIPIEDDAEEKQLRNVAQTVKGIVCCSENKRNLDGSLAVEFFGHVKEIIEFVGAIASMYSVYTTVRVQITDSNNNTKKNIKIEDVPKILKDE